MAQQFTWKESSQETAWFPDLQGQLMVLIWKYFFFWLIISLMFTYVLKQMSNSENFNGDPWLGQENMDYNGAWCCCAACGRSKLWAEHTVGRRQGEAELPPWPLWRLGRTLCHGQSPYCHRPGLCHRLSNPHLCGLMSWPQPIPTALPSHSSSIWLQRPSPALPTSPPWPPFPAPYPEGQHLLLPLTTKSLYSFFLGYISAEMAQKCVCPRNVAVQWKP